MHLSLLQYIFAAVASYIGEMFGSIFGGGSFVIQPALLALGIEPHHAVANDVTAAAFSSLFFSIYTCRKQRPDIKVAVWMSLPMIAGAFLGGVILSRIPEQIVAWIILLICLIGLAHMLIHLKYPIVEDGKRKIFKYWHIPALLIGFGLGVYDGISGAGSGVLTIIALTLLFGKTMKSTLATSGVLCSICEGAAAFSFWYLGLLDGKLLLVMIPACSLAGLTGAKIVHSVSEKTLRIGFACIISALIAYLVIQRI